MSTTPYMNLTLPDPTVTAGPAWATELNAAVTAIDSHDHSPGKGTPVPTSGLNINADLSANSKAVTDLERTAFTSQASSLPISKINSVYVINGDLWYNNSAGVPVQLTAGSSITSASSPLVPSGVIWPYGGTSAPTGFLLCDGSAVSRVTYAALFAVIGTIYGVGDGSTTFNLPSANGRVPMGAGTYTDTVSGSVTRTLGASLGAEKHVLTTGELATHNHIDAGHTHGITDPGHVHTSASPASPYNAGIGGIVTNAAGPSASATTGITINSGNASIQNTGSNTPHNNVQPSFVTNYIIKT